MTIETAPAGGEVRVDDGPPQPTPAVIALVAGGHVLNATLAGHHAVERAFVVRGGESDRIEVALRPIEDPADRLFARGRALAERGEPAEALATLREGEAREPSPRFALEVARTALSLKDCAGTAAALERFDARCEDCALRPEGEQTRLAHAALCAPPAPAPTEDGLSPWVWTGLGLGVVGAAFGGTFHALYFDAVDARDAAEDRGESITTLRARHDEAVLDYQLMQVGYIAGAVGLAGALTAWLLDTPPTAEARLQVTGPGVAFSLRF